MVERIYAIYDRQAKHILKGNIPFVMMYPNDAVAKREFTEIVEGIPQLRKHPDDYVLGYLGTLDTETGIITPVERNTLTPPLQNVDTVIMSVRDVIQMQFDFQKQQERNAAPSGPAVPAAETLTTEPKKKGRK